MSSSPFAHLHNHLHPRHKKMRLSIRTLTKRCPVQTSLTSHRCPSSSCRTLATTVNVDPQDQHRAPSSASNENETELNQNIRECFRKLPIRPRRLDHKFISDKSRPEDILIESLDNGRSPIGSSYARARSPVYFPNVSIRLVRPSSTDRGDPYTAIFRCDLRLTKPDIFNYLRQIYGLGITSIRTAIYRGRYQRMIKSKVRGGVKIDRNKNRTFKKVWVGLDRPFFYPSQPNSKFLSENYNYEDLLNSYNRVRAAQLEQQTTKIDRSQVLPSGVHHLKGQRINVFRQILDSKKSLQPQLTDSVKKSLAESTAPSSSETKKD